MRKTLIAAALVLAAGSLGRADVELTGNLDGLQEVPPNASPSFGDIDGTLSGSAGSFVFNFNGTYADMLGGLNSAAIQQAAPGASGSTVYSVAGGALQIGTMSGAFSDSWRFDDPNFPLTDARAAALLAGGDYINLRTNVFPSGEIRGQIEVVPEPASAMILTVAAVPLMSRRRRA